MTRLFLSKPSIPVIDFVGKIVEPADGETFRPGQYVFGASGKGFLGSALAEYSLAKKGAIAALPEGVDPKWGATACIAGLTAYQSIVPHVKEGSNVFLNGGSGGTGVFGIQIAKAKGCYVATCCSTPNVELCKRLGADEVIDYKQQNVAEALQASGRKYDHVVDNVGSPDLYWKMHEWTAPHAKFIMVGAKITPRFFGQAIAMRLQPSFLGGGQRKVEGFQTKPVEADLAQIGKWMQQGVVRPVIDSEYQLEEAPKAFEKLKTDRAKGKIIVHVTSGQ